MPSNEVLRRNGRDTERGAGDGGDERNIVSDAWTSVKLLYRERRILRNTKKKKKRTVLTSLFHMLSRIKKKKRKHT